MSHQTSSLALTRSVQATQQSQPTKLDGRDGKSAHKYVLRVGSHHLPIRFGLMKNAPLNMQAQTHANVAQQEIYILSPRFADLLQCVYFYIFKDSILTLPRVQDRFLHQHYSVKIMSMLSFAQALQDSSQCNRRHVLLGNGFSIACRPAIFAYGKLFEQADFSQISPTAKSAFLALATQDFEKVIKALKDAAAIVNGYGGPAKLAQQLASDASGLRELLVQTIAATHPAWPGELTEQEYKICRAFLANFDTIYTLNYDLLLYWVQMHTQEGEDPHSDDGFRKPTDDFDSAYVVWEPGQSHDQNNWFLHGALHIFDAEIEIQKYTWRNTGVRLIDQIRDALNKDYFPLFVSEGTSLEKYKHIRHNDYLAKGYRSFSSIQGALFVFGHSLAENDDHYLRCIQKGKISHLYVGIYGDPEMHSNKYIMRRANQLAEGRRPRNPLTVQFYNAASANVWK